MQIAEKPATKVAEDLITFGYQHFELIYNDMDEEEIFVILQTEHDSETG